MNEAKQARLSLLLLYTEDYLLPLLAIKKNISNNILIKKNIILAQKLPRTINERTAKKHVIISVGLCHKLKMTYVYIYIYISEH